MLDNVGLRYPHRASGAKAPRTLRPLPLLRFAVSATGALTFAASSIICAFGLASAAPRSPYRHLELCGIAFVFPALCFGGTIAVFGCPVGGISRSAGAGICGRIRGRSFRCGGFLGRFLRCSIGVLCAAAGAVAVLEVMPQGIHILALIILAGILIAMVVGVALLRAGGGDDLTPIGVFRVRGRGGIAAAGAVCPVGSIGRTAVAGIFIGSFSGFGRYAAVVLDTMLLATETSLSPVWVGTAVRAGRVSSVM